MIPRYQAVIGRQVFRPKEAFLAKFNRIGHEVEHGNPNRHLDQHGQTSTHRTDAILRVKGHHGLLLLHGIILVGILLAELVDFGFQHAHFRAAHKALAGRYVDNEAQQDGDEQQHNTHGQPQAGEEVKHIERKEAVDPLEQRPAQIDQLLHFQVPLAANGMLVHRLEQAEMIGTKVELQLRRRFSCRVVSCLHLSIVCLEMALFVALLHHCAFDALHLEGNIGD